MSIELLTVAIVAAFLLFLFAGAPIAFITGGISAFTVWFLWGPDRFGMIVLRVFEQMSSYTFLAAPMFIFMAAMLKRSGIIEDLYKAMHTWMGPVRGGLALATVVACTIIAAMVGIIGAGIALMGTIALPEMIRRGYNKYLAAGTICAAGALGILIPPSILFIIYSMIAGVSVGALFAGGLGAGLLLAAMYFVYILGRCFFIPSDGPSLPVEQRQLVSILDKLSMAKSLVLPVILVVLVVGSIFVGAATPSEAAGVGALGAILITALRRRLTMSGLYQASLETVLISAMIMWIIFGATSLVSIYNLAGGGRYLTGLLEGLPFGEWGVFFIVQGLLILMGLFLDWIGVIMLVGPFIVPLMTNLGFDPLWFGVVFALNMQIAFLTPPFGPALFYLKGVAPPSISMMDLYRAAMPFVGIQILAIILVIIFPEIITWLPNRLFG